MYIKVLLVCSQHRGYKEGQIAESFGKITTSLPESGNHLPTIAWSNPANQHIYIYVYVYSAGQLLRTSFWNFFGGYAPST